MKELGRLLNRKTILLILAAACICVVAVFAGDFSDCGIDNYKIKVREYNWLINGHTDEIVATLKEQFSEMTNLEQVVKECKDNGLWSPDGLFTDSGVEAINKMAMDSGLIDKPVAKSDLVDDSFAKKAAGK